MEGETKCQDLYSRLKTEDPYEVWLCVILRKAKTVRGKRRVKKKKGGKRYRGLKISSEKYSYKYVSTSCQH